jgi:hypothetical protein
MQFTKDTFYLVLRDRLAALNAERKVVVDGVERPAVLVRENEPVNAAPPLPTAYYLEWGPAQVVGGSENISRPLMKMDCFISYRSAPLMAGSVDRGRALCALDTELLCLLTPPRTPKLDTNMSPAAALGSFIFWAGVEFREATKDFDRTAALPIFFFSEVEQA